MNLRPFVQPGLDQLRKLWLPFVAIQFVGLAIVVSYFLVPSVGRAMDLIADVKQRGGLLFAATAMAFACAIVPEVFKTITGVDRSFTRERRSFLVHNLVVFASIGVIQTFFYDFLAWQFGDSRRPSIVFAKSAVDMLIYSPLIPVPLICFSFTLRRHGYRLGDALRQLGPTWYLREAVPVIVVNMAYWWPMGLLMYTLPPRLTFVYGVTGSAASATLLTAIASNTKDPRDTPPLAAAVD